MAGVSTRSLAVRGLLALLLVSGSLMHVRAKETHDERKIEKDGHYGDMVNECSNYDLQSEECQYDQCRLECNLDFQDCLANPSTCTELYAAPSLQQNPPRTERGASKRSGEGALIGRRFVQHGG
jgi:hypothetical protein